MRRWVVAVLLLSLVLAGCGGADQKLRESASQSAREAASEVNTTRLAVEQLRAGRLWSQPAERMVADAEKNLDKAVSSFEAEQPATEVSARLYEQATKSLDDAQTTVTAVRIALGNDDLAAAEQQLEALRRVGDSLDTIGELAK